ncbi:MAG: hypothetical protein LUQ59_10660 [Methanothrix sp.]|nr:hypothetical protein [Methanothrix sp.]
MKTIAATKHRIIMLLLPNPNMPQLHPEQNLDTPSAWFTAEVAFDTSLSMAYPFLSLTATI